MSLMTILIVDDHAIVREGLRRLLEAQFPHVVIEEVQDAESAVLRTRTLKPDLILMDLIMPGMSGIDGIQQISTLGLTTRILVLTSSLEDHLVKEALAAGAHGYLLKASRPSDLFQAIDRVMSGQTALDAEVSHKLVRSVQAGDPLHELTDRERDIFDAMARGMTNSDIATRLVISEGTVRTHVANVLGKLQLRDRTQVTVYALKRGLVRLDELP